MYLNAEFENIATAAVRRGDIKVTNLVNLMVVVTSLRTTARQRTVHHHAISKWTHGVTHGLNVRRFKVHPASFTYRWDAVSDLLSLQNIKKHGK